MGDEPDRVWIVFLIGVAAVLLCALMAVILSIRSAGAQDMPCKPFAEIKETLARLYQEHETDFGQSGPQQVIVLFRSEGGKTWTLLSVNTAGIACVVGAGANWTDGGRGV